MFQLASRGKPLEFEIQIPTAVGIGNSKLGHFACICIPHHHSTGKSLHVGCIQAQIQILVSNGHLPVWFSARIRLVVSWPPCSHWSWGVGGGSMESTSLADHAAAFLLMWHQDKFECSGAPTNRQLSLLSSNRVSRSCSNSKTRRGPTGANGASTAIACLLV